MSNPADIQTRVLRCANRSGYDIGDPTVEIESPIKAWLRGNVTHVAGEVEVEIEIDLDEPDWSVSDQITHSTYEAIDSDLEGRDHQQLEADEDAYWRHVNLKIDERLGK